MQDETIKDTEVKDQNQQCECQKSDCEACSKESEPTQTAQAQEENAQNTAEKEPSVEELLAAAKEENAKLQDLYMRALAEAENARRRFISAVIPYDQFFRNTGHGKGHAHNHGNAGRRRGQGCNTVSPQPLLPLDLRRAPFNSGYTFLSTPHW